MTIPHTRLLPHPMQPIGYDDRKILRYKRNAIVDALLNERLDMNEIVLRVLRGMFSLEDYTQFVQLVGYSVSGAGDLSAFDPGTHRKAQEEVARLRAEEAHTESLAPLLAKERNSP